MTVEIDGAPSPSATSALPERGEAFTSGLALGVGDLVIGVAGDSTGNEVSEWPELLMGLLGAAHPDRTFKRSLWSDGSQAMPAPTTLQMGTTPDPGVVFQDTFTRTAGDLYSTVPDVGGAWGRDGGNAAGDWSLNGTQAVRTADATTGTMLADGLQVGDKRTTFVGSLSSASTGVARYIDLVHEYVDASNSIFCRFNVNTSGFATAVLYKRIGGVNTQLGSTLSSPVPMAAGSPTAVTWTIAREGTVVTATIGGQTATGSVSSGEATTLSAATKSGFGNQGTTGDVIDTFTISLINPDPRPTPAKGMADPRLTLHLPGKVLEARPTATATVTEQQVVFAIPIADFYEHKRLDLVVKYQVPKG